MIPLIIQLLSIVIRLYIWALIVAAIVSMLTQFGVLDTRNRLVWAIDDFLVRVTAPILRPIQRVLPNFGGIDLSPLVAILLLELVQGMLGRLEYAIEIGSMRPLLF